MKKVITDWRQEMIRIITHLKQVQQQATDQIQEILPGAAAVIKVTEAQIDFNIPNHANIIEVEGSEFIVTPTGAAEWGKTSGELSQYPYLSIQFKQSKP